MKKKQTPKLKLVKTTVSRLSGAQTDKLKGGLLTTGHPRCESEVVCQTDLCVTELCQ